MSKTCINPGKCNIKLEGNIGIAVHPILSVLDLTENSLTDRGTTLVSTALTNLSELFLSKQTSNRGDNRIEEIGTISISMGLRYL